MIPWAEAPDPIALYDAVGDSTYIEWLLDAIRNQRVLRDVERDIAVLVPGSGRARHRQPLLGAPPPGRAEQHVGRGGRRDLPQASAPRRDRDRRRSSRWPTRSRPRASRTSRRCSVACSWESGDEPPSPLVLVQRFLHNSTEGWALALTSLRDLYANAESVGPRRIRRSAARSWTTRMPRSSPSRCGSAR